MQGFLGAAATRPMSPGFTPAARMDMATLRLLPTRLLSDKQFDSLTFYLFF